MNEWVDEDIVKGERYRRDQRKAQARVTMSDVPSKLLWLTRLADPEPRSLAHRVLPEAVHLPVSCIYESTRPISHNTCRQLGFSQSSTDGLGGWGSRDDSLSILHAHTGLFQWLGALAEHRGELLPCACPLA